MISKLLRKLAMRILIAFGYSSSGAGYLFKDIKDDFVMVKMNFAKRLWAYRRGFVGRRINEYGLNDLNYKDYETDLHYFKLHPINEYSKWIDDKLTYKYILHPFSAFLPRYYFQLQKGVVRKLMDCPADLAAEIAAVIRLLHREKQLVLKLLAGSGGFGFYKLAVRDDKYLVGDVVMVDSDLAKFLSSLNNYIVSEYLIAHEFIQKIWDRSPSTLRVMTVSNADEDPVIVGAYMRFGTATTGFVENISDGAIACGVDITNGMLFKPKYRQGDQWIDSSVHRDSQARIEGQLPYWDLIAKTVLEICAYVPLLKYMGFDIIITQKGFKIIEINSLGAIYTIQLYYPFLKNKQIKRLLYEK